MSKFVDKLNRTAREAPQAIGFGRLPSTSEKSKILLVVVLSEASLSEAASFVDGADAVLLSVVKFDAGAKDIKRMGELVPNIPCGGWIKGAKQGKWKEVAKAGSDFVVFPSAETPLTMFQDEDIGRILEVEPSADEGLLGAVNGLPVDAVLVAGEEAGYSLTWRHLMQFRRFVDLLDKPVLVSVSSNVTANELGMLWEIGIDGAVIEAGEGQPAEKLKELRQAVDNLDFAPQRKRGKSAVLLPPLGRDSGITAEEEEDLFYS